MNVSGNKYSDIHNALIKECIKNNRKAQIELYRLYSGAVFNTCLRILKKREIAEDVMQETFITAFEKLSSFRNESSLGAWLKRIAINKSVDELRKNKMVFEQIEESAENFNTDEPFYFEIDDEDNSNQIQSIKNAMNLLPDGYRLVLSLYLFEGYDHEEISFIMNISESTSRSQFTRAKQKLAEILKNTMDYQNEKE
jgi:RNA polymerase sigma-70 factor (ECF subfamily)